MSLGPQLDPAPPHRLAWGLVGAAWCLVLALHLSVAADAWSWAQAHAEVEGQRPGARALSGELVAWQRRPRHPSPAELQEALSRDPPPAPLRAPAHAVWTPAPGEGEPGCRLLVREADGRVRPFLWEGPPSPAWKPGLRLAMRQASAHPELVALVGSPQASASAMRTWAVDLPGAAPEVLWPTAVALLAGLGSWAAFWWRSFRPAPRPPWWPGLLLALVLGLVAFPLGLATHLLGQVGSPSVDWGPEELVPVVAPPGPPRPRTLWVRPASDRMVMGEFQSMTMGEPWVRHLKPGDRLMVVPDLAKRGRLFWADLVPGLVAEQAWLGRALRALWAVPLALGLHALVALGLSLWAWRERRSLALAGLQAPPPP